MLKRNITYKDFNGNECVETFYFNLSEPELVEMEVSEKEGLSATLRNVIAAEDKATIVAAFKRIILAAFGVKSDDGKRFIKSDELRQEFEQHAAYAVLFMELASSDTAASDFLTGVLPENFSASIMNEVKNGNPPQQLPPPPPTV